MSSPNSWSLIVINDLQGSLIINVDFCRTILWASQVSQDMLQMLGSFGSIMSSNEFSFSGAGGGECLSFGSAWNCPS